MKLVNDLCPGVSCNLMNIKDWAKIFFLCYITKSFPMKQCIRIFNSLIVKFKDHMSL